MTDRYPDHAGAKGLSFATLATSSESADAIQPHRLRLHLIAMHTLSALGTATPFEAVAASGVKGSALQPRFSELIQQGLIAPTGERRRNPDTGKSAAVLALTELARARLEGGAE